MVPLRGIFEALGAKVEWDSDTKTVTASKENTTISLPIDSKNALLNGQVVTLDVSAKIVNGRTMVPIRFVSESMGCKVNWDGSTSTIKINSIDYTGNYEQNSKNIYIINSLEKDLNNDGIKEKASLAYKKEYEDCYSLILDINGMRKTILSDIRDLGIISKEEINELVELHSIKEKNNLNEQIVLLIKMNTSDRGYILYEALGFDYKGNELWKINKDFELPEFTYNYKGNNTVTIKITDFNVDKDIYIDLDSYLNRNDIGANLEEVFNSKNESKVWEYIECSVDDYDNDGVKEIKTIGRLEYGVYVCDLVTTYKLSNGYIIPIKYEPERTN